ncbi:hypothetical protein [Streptomyces sp. NPDC012888]|uniref:MmyB family transcriptional regulator n=1 Tax=Streptomyces sp. NPDC012888 TaxID=3364855 RepID=UPI00368A63B4
MRGKTQDAEHFHHPDVGPLTLAHQAFGVRAAPGPQLVVHQAGPATPSARALTLLGTLHATARRSAPATATTHGPPSARPRTGGPGRTALPAPRRRLTCRYDPWRSP